LLTDARDAPLPVFATRPAAPSESAVEVTIDASRSADTQLDVVVPYRGRRRARRIDLGDVAPNARSRTLALALAESVERALDLRDDKTDASGANAAFSPERAAPPAPTPLEITPQTTAHAVELQAPQVRPALASFRRAVQARCSRARRSFAKRSRARRRLPAWTPRRASAPTACTSAR
jgi:hypothetical protein